MSDKKSPIPLREMLSSNWALSRKLSDLERKVDVHDNRIREVFEAIRQLLSEPEPPRRRIGFHDWNSKEPTIRERRGIYRSRRRASPAVIHGKVSR